VNPVVFWIASVVGLGIAYLLGATPTGYWAGKLLKGIDIREHGSRSTGATNVFRTVGKWPALVVLLVDVLKGVAALVLVRWLYTLPSVKPPLALDLQSWGPWAVCLAGLAALFGHSHSIWLNFTGGKSAATGLGVLLAMSWPVGVGAAVAFAAVLAVFSDCFPEFDAGGADCDRPRLRLGAAAALSAAGDCRRHLRDRAPSCQHSAAVGGYGTARRTKRLAYLVEPRPRHWPRRC
jgi:glycerol-3-phosphate acyltransferase PlsY